MLNPLEKIVVLACINADGTIEYFLTFKLVDAAWFLYFQFVAEAAQQTKFLPNNLSQKDQAKTNLRKLFVHKFI